MNLNDNYHVISSSNPERYARGWHCLGLSEKFRDGKPHKLTIFGTEVVVFESSESKKLNVISAFCPHLGGDLGGGKIKGDSLACPFHDWRWNGDGKCAGIPYAKRVPNRARTKSWITCEENRQLFIWNDPEGNPPSAGVIIPRIEEAFSNTWSNWDWSYHEVDTNGRELIDNLADVAHFFYVHGEGKGGGCSYFKNIFEEHFATQYLEIGALDAQNEYRKDAPFTGDPRELSCWTRGESTYYGPAYLISRLLLKSNDDYCEVYEILAPYPITNARFALQIGFIVADNPALNQSQNEQRANTVIELLRAGTLQDVHIWNSKTRIDNPLLCDSDGPFYQLRRWYEQFFVNVDDIEPDMIRKFERETNTRHSLMVWEQQAAEAIAEEEFLQGC
jgi:3-ketosteroid 9alpha-monooxygenase subunit A